MDFAFLVMQTMRFYRWSWAETMKTPVSAFWTCNKFIDRLRADEMIAQLPALTYSNANEGRAEIIKALEEQKGTVVVEKPVFDAEGWRSLKKLSQ